MKKYINFKMDQSPECFINALNHDYIINNQILNNHNNNPIYYQHLFNHYYAFFMNCANEINKLQNIHNNNESPNHQLINDDRSLYDNFYNYNDACLADGLLTNEEIVDDFLNFSDDISNYSEQSIDSEQVADNNEILSKSSKKNVSFDMIREYFIYPIKDASKKLGISMTLIKKICRKNGIKRWPYRKLKSENDLTKFDENSVIN
jgi:hypothetical protein